MTIRLFYTLWGTLAFNTAAKPTGNANRPWSRCGQVLLSMLKMPSVFFSFLLPGALLGALSCGGNGAPYGLQHGCRHFVPSFTGAHAPG